MHKKAAEPLVLAPDNQEYQTKYARHLESIGAQYANRGEAMSLAIGGQFDAFGTLMKWLLIDEGLLPEHTLIDVGCGSGRLAKQLVSYLRGSYIGTDILPDFLAHASSVCNRSDWRFELVQGMEIPANDLSADMVCFFSVFTHLLHEDSYRYLLEAHRVLRPGGRVVFSFLEFAVPSTWTVFENTVRARQAHVPHHHNQFLSRDAIQAWSHYAGFAVTHIYDGNVPHISLRHPVTLDDGTILQDKGALGQSVCTLTKN